MYQDNVQARAAYESAIQAALDEFNRITRQAWQEYARGRLQAEAEYDRSTALAFVAAYRRQCGGAMQAAM